MTTAQLASRLGMTQPGVIQLEQSEANGSAAFKTLKRAAEALDCQLVYAMVPRGSLEGMIEARALEIARARLAEVGHSMALEAQEVTGTDAEAQLAQEVRNLIGRGGSRLWRDV